MLYSKVGRLFFLSQPFTPVMDLLQDPVGLIASGRSGLIIVDVIIRRDPAGDQVRFFGSDASVGVEGESLLKDHGIHITGGELPPKQKFPRP